MSRQTVTTEGQTREKTKQSFVVGRTGQSTGMEAGREGGLLFKLVTEMPRQGDNVTQLQSHARIKGGGRGNRLSLVGG